MRALKSLASIIFYFPKVIDKWKIVNDLLQENASDDKILNAWKEYQEAVNHIQSLDATTSVLKLHYERRRILALWSFAFKTAYVGSIIFLDVIKYFGVLKK